MNNKHLRLLPLLLALLVPAMAAAQQVQTRRYTRGVLAFPEYRDARITFSFLRHGKAKANIFLKDASLIYRKDSTVMRADLSNVLRVDFDSVSYQRVEDRLGRVLAEKGGNSLVVVTTIDLDYLNADARRGDNLPYFELPDFNIFLEVNADSHYDAHRGYPLKDTYYFITKGDPVPASEKAFKRHVRPERLNDFKELMKDRFWSWKDARSLKVLLDYL